MAAHAPVRPYRILLVEDDPADAMLVEEALLDGSEGDRSLVQMSDGVAALEYLRDPAQPRPDLIVLDLNMPRMSGAEMLKILKQEPSLKAIPVVVLTTSAADEDVASAYATHASAYVVKPVNLDDFIEAVRNIDTFYRELAEHLPGDPRTDG
ncbi:response regulator [Actinoallomurus iriomotensis]|uniref:Response regulator n=1 Tax=Actinoallomurus iriomotensis TaxID=478107 RepID=A0A9W6S1N2_9ACTN|nr:response regulator [Actinoallomurus iriomotensis]GLY85636.1 response regulator [Actinoallomurus iriomotensis]